jgi:hypothetical protein
MSFLKEVEEVYPAITNRQRLTLLRNWLDLPSAELLDEELQRQPDLDYELVWARLDLGFGGDDREALRRQLRSLRLNTRGKLTEREWREFAMRGMTLSKQIGNISDTELGRIFFEQLPAHPWRRKLVEEVEKRQHHSVLVMEGFPSGTQVGEVEGLVTMETGAAPHRVNADGDKFKVTTSSNHQKEMLKMAFDRQTLQCGATLTVSAEAHELGAEDVNALMLKWLRIDAKVNATPQRDTDTDSLMRRQQRYARQIAEAEDEMRADQDAETAVAAVRDARAGKGKDDKSKAASPSATSVQTSSTPLSSAPQPTTPQQQQPRTPPQGQTAQPAQPSSSSSSSPVGSGTWPSKGESWRGGSKGGWQNGGSQDWHGRWRDGRADQWQRSGAAPGSTWRARDDDWRYSNRTEGWQPQVGKGWHSTTEGGKGGKGKGKGKGGHQE